MIFLIVCDAIIALTSHGDLENREFNGPSEINFVYRVRDGSRGIFFSMNMEFVKMMV